MNIIFNYFNSMNIVLKTTIVAMIFLILVLIITIIVLLVQNRKVMNEEVDLEFLNKLNNIKNENKDVVIEVNNEVKDNTVNSDKLDIGSITKKIEEDIEKNNIELTDFEMEQEEKAIISYKELLSKVKDDPIEDKVKVNLKTVSLDKDYNNQDNEYTFSTEILDFSDIDKDNVESAKFKNSAFVSPVDGIQDKTNEILKQENIKGILNIDNINKNVMSSDEFLDALKELRDSL